MKKAVFFMLWCGLNIFTAQAMEGSDMSPYVPSPNGMVNETMETDETVPASGNQSPRIRRRSILPFLADLLVKAHLTPEVVATWTEKQLSHSQIAARRIVLHGIQTGQLTRCHKSQFHDLTFAVGVQLLETNSSESAHLPLINFEVLTVLEGWKAHPAEQIAEVPGDKRTRTISPFSEDVVPDPLRQHASVHRASEEAQANFRRQAPRLFDKMEAAMQATIQRH